MHDDFLHRLRKTPRPEFAARLHARLRRQSTPALRPAAPSRVRTLITLLLLGGAAFAVTFVAMRGLPAPVAEWYRETAARISGGRAASSGHQPGNGAVRGGLRWSTSTSHPEAGPPLHGEPDHSAAAATSAPPAATSAAAHAGRSAPAGALAPGLPRARIEAVSSWAAYPYATALTARLSRVIAVSAVHSQRWLGALCGGASGPALAYTFARVGTVSHLPCPRNASGLPSPVAAVSVGYEAVVLARSPIYDALDLTRREVFLALAKWVPDPTRPGVVHENPNTVWRQIDPALGPEPIELMGPPLSSPAGRSMIELLMQGGCDSYTWVAALKLADPDRYARICRTVRTDGAYLEVSGLDATRLLTQPNVVGILEYRSLTGSAAWNLAVSRLDGVRPTPQSIENGTYPGSHALYLYVNRQRAAPNVVTPLLLDAPLGRADWALIGLPWQQRLAALHEVFGQ
jgi:phosphate transport system substrate-binding protein